MQTRTALLARLGIRQKLSLLLIIPLAAVVLLMVPFTAERVDGVRAADVTANAAQAARAVDELVEALQRERLLVIGFLSSSDFDRTAVVAQRQTAADRTARLRDDPVTAPALAHAREQLAAVDQVRAAVLSRGTTVREAYDAYRAAIGALLDGLDLSNPVGADTVGHVRLNELDALMRAGEETSSVGALLVALAVGRDFSVSALTDTVTAGQVHLKRFRELADAEQVDAVDVTEDSQAARRIRQLTTATVEATATKLTGSVNAALSAAISYTGLRRLAQDRIARQVSLEARSRAVAAQRAATGFASGGALLFVFVVALGVTVSRSISRPLRQLTRAASIVAELSQAELVRVADSDSSDPAPPRLAAVDVRSADEVGELATALNRVQATAALLLERQVTTRHNVSVMFANIARRTQNLVGRQLSLIDNLERSESDPDLLQRLYQLDHVATRLRRSADSLLVVSGTIDQEMSGRPTPLVDVIRSAVAEIEGFREVEFGSISEVNVSAGLVSDLRLMLSELMENATHFSPPGTTVRVSASLADRCRIVIVDHGLGMSAQRLAEENRRLIDRERLDVAPTSVLGLFVVGRLARRHGLAVRLEPSDGRGVTAVVEIGMASLTPATPGGDRGGAGRQSDPAGRHRTITGSASVGSEPQQPFGTVPFGAVPPARPPVLPPVAHRPVAAITATDERGRVDLSSELFVPVRDFPWFAPPAVAVGRASVTTPDIPELPAAPVGAPPREQWPFAETTSGAVADADVASSLPRRRVDPSVEAAAMSAWASAGVVEPSTAAPPMPLRPAPPPPSSAGPSTEPTRAGLTRRVAGAHMNSLMRDIPTDPATVRIVRDPEAERAALNDFLSGHARGVDSGTGEPPPVA